MEKHVHRRVRIRRPGLNVDADVDAVISVNVSERASDATAESEEDVRPSATSEPPPEEDEGGER